MTIMLTIFFLLLDVISKLIVSKYLVLNNSKVIIEGFFNLTYVKNTGAAFSIFSNSTLIVTVTSLLIIGLIILYLYKNKITNKLEIVAYSLILGGAIGNFLNRIIYGYVIDFLDFRIFRHDFAIFNLADVFIVMGVGLILFCTWRNGYGNKGRR